MVIIKQLTEKISEEIKDSTCYGKMALEFRDSDPILAEVLHRLSIEEMNHMSMLHNEVARIIQKYQQEHGDPPAAMLAVYEWKHKEAIEAAGEAKALQNLYDQKLNP